MSNHCDRRLADQTRFVRAVLSRDNGVCVFCGALATDVHQIFASELWDDGGFFEDNGASVCSVHYRACRSTVISVEAAVAAVGLETPVLPPHLYAVQRYDTWGNAILNDGRRTRGELFHLAAVQAALHQGDVLEGFTDWVRYPRTHTLPWSESLGEGDLVMSSLSRLSGRRVVATEKMDGENISLYRDFIHSRSVRPSSHPTRVWLDDYWKSRQSDIPAGWRVCGEYLYARHTIGYSNLKSYFLGFSVWTDENECLSWDDTLEFFARRDILPVRVLFDDEYDHDAMRQIWPRAGSRDSEGYVLRTASQFHYRDFRRCVGKFIRSGYFQSYPLRDEHAATLEHNNISS